ncbi:Txe/YoeB family addiction module toxin [Kocuria rhizophila]|nr:Txe/YoeB family addiction module toxin [Kocuria rhizophila]
MRPVWDEAAWRTTTYWQTADRIKRINLLIDACLRQPLRASGKPEQLVRWCGGSWSRRINQEHRRSTS